MPYIGKSPSAGVRQRYQYTATAGQTTFSGTDLGNLTLTYTDNNFVDVFQNGVLLKGGGTDYTATSGTSVVLTTGASVSDVIEIIVYDVFSVGNFYNRTDSDSRYVNVDGDTMTGTLALNVSGSSHLTTTTSGTSNLVLGVNAGNSITSGGNYNVCIGDEAGTAITTGDQNVAIGYQSLDANDEGIRNVAIGTTALTSDTKGEASTAIGHGALYAQNFTSSTTSYNTAVGYHAGVNLTTGVRNTLIGSDVADALTTGNQNTIIGEGAGSALTDADYNVVVGRAALPTDTKGSRTTAIGYNALGTQNFTSSSDSYNTAVGYEAGQAVTTGTSVTAVGGRAGHSKTTGNGTFVGASAGRYVTTATSGTFVGTEAGKGNSSSPLTGNFNTSIGDQSGLKLEGAARTNTFLGAYAGYYNGYDSTTNGITTGTNNTCIGFAAYPSSATVSDEFTLGDNDVNNLRCNDTSISSLSDERDKTNIVDIPLGLDFIKTLRPVSFDWDRRDGTNVGKKGFGFIAQELKKAQDATSYADHMRLVNTGYVLVPDAENKNEGKVDEDGNPILDKSGKIEESLEADPMKTYPILIKAIQELSAKNDALEARIKKLEDG